MARGRRRRRKGGRQTGAQKSESECEQRAVIFFSSLHSPFMILTALRHLQPATRRACTSLLPALSAALPQPPPPSLLLQTRPRMSCAVAPPPSAAAVGTDRKKVCRVACVCGDGVLCGSVACGLEIGERERVSDRRRIGRVEGILGNSALASMVQRVH